MPEPTPVPRAVTPSLADQIRFAIHDPGAFTPRANRDDPDPSRRETVWNWAARAVLAVLDATDGHPIPPGLVAVPHIRYTVHCSHCGKPAGGYEYPEHPAMWEHSDLGKLGDYHLEDSDWHVNRPDLPDFEYGGRALACDECWCAGWCDLCGYEIHAWEPKTDGDRAGDMWHTDCEAAVAKVQAVLDALPPAAIGRSAGLPADLADLADEYRNLIALRDHPCHPDLDQKLGVITAAIREKTGAGHA